MVVFYLLSGFLLFDLKFENSEEGGMQSSELRWTFRDQEVATEERGATVSNGSCWGTLQKKLFAPAAAAAGGPLAAAQCLYGENLEIVEKKN